jgi:hypothetical protein
MICGQAPSDYPEFAEFIMQEGIEAMSLNPDSVMKTIIKLGGLGKKRGWSRKNLGHKKILVNYRAGHYC